MFQVSWFQGNQRMSKRYDCARWAERQAQAMERMTGWATMTAPNGDKLDHWREIGHVCGTCLAYDDYCNVATLIEYDAMNERLLDV